MADSEWLAVLGRFGLVRGSFIPPKDLREFRLVSRYRRKLASPSWRAEKNRLQDSGRRRQTQNGKARKGNVVIRSIPCQCANAARRTKSEFAEKYRSLVVRRGHKKAIVALAHKLIRTIFFLLTRRQPYSDSGFD